MSDPSWPVVLSVNTNHGWFVGRRGEERRKRGEKEEEEGSGSRRPAAVRPPPPTTESPRPHLPKRGHTKAQRETESCHNRPRATDRNERHMILNHTGAAGRRRRGRPRSVTTANVRLHALRYGHKAARCDSRFSRNDRVFSPLKYPSSPRSSAPHPAGGKKSS